VSEAATNGRTGDGRRTAMSPRAKRLFLVGLATWVAVAIAGGFAYAFFHRHDTICSDGKPPALQHDVGLGQVRYLCHNGEEVEK